MNSRNCLKRAVAWSFIVLGSLTVASAMAGCSGAPAATPGGASEAGHEPANGAAAQGPTLQFDNGSYDIKKRINNVDTVVGTLWVNSSASRYKELWVLATASGYGPCNDNSCDISGVTVWQRTSEECAAWRTYANDIGTRNIYGVTFATGNVRCTLTPCQYSGTSTASFSLLPVGRYKVDANRRIFVESGNREHWFMAQNLGSTGGTISTETNNTQDLQTFACGTCPNANADLTVYTPTYTELSNFPSTCQ